MIRGIVLLLACMISIPRLAAQTVLQPEAPLDSARASLRDALLVLRDSLNSIDGAAARLQRDFREASGASLLSRARVMRDACARSVRTIKPTRKAVLSASLSEPRRVERRTELVAEMDRLNRALLGCESEFAAMSRSDQAETVRGYGNDRAVKVQSAIRKYEKSLRDFLAAMGIRVMLLGAHSQSAAG